MIPSIEFPHDESCMKVEIHYPTDNSVGYLSFSIADKNGETYDWENALCANCGILQLAYIQEILIGEMETLNDGKPMDMGGTLMMAKHILSPDNAYAFGLKKGDEKRQILLGRNEAVALSETMRTSFFFISFVKGVS